MSLCIAAALCIAQAAPPAPAAHVILARYVQAIGGETALRGVKNRITEGEFDNGRGLATRFKTVDEAPNRRTTIIGTDPIDGPMGSGRGFDGVNGWDKSFIGTGLRSLDGRELADAARDADLLRPMHLLDDCASTRVENRGGDDIIVCTVKAGGVVRHTFDTRTGLLSSQDVDAGSRQIHISYEDYRFVDGVRLPFKTHIAVAGATIKYDASSIRHNQPIDPAIFRRPQ